MTGALFHESLADALRDCIAIFWGLSSGREQIEFPDSHLRPIRGDGLAESDDIETPKHVEDATA